ncbi:MAG: SusC/RagA family TonB-linked outer membrane protein [Gemmatimonadota bacterium]
MICLTALAVAIPMETQAQQTGRIVGTVTDAQSGGPLASVQVFVEGAGVGTVGGADGSFAIENVPAGTHSVVAQRLGYSQVRQGDVTVTAGAATTLNLAMAPQALALQGIVATGLVDPVEGVRSPIAVARVTREMMPVTVGGSSGAIENLAGRVAGVRINRNNTGPGSGVSIMLRTPTSLRGGGSPLVVVDGVILSGEGVPGTVDLESMDIESMEVIRGAAASSLYGSRAASGVISITTARGQALGIGQTRFTARTEFGVSQNLRTPDLNNSHAYYMNAAGTEYTLADGVTVVDRAARVRPADARSFLDNPYPGPIYDNVGAITQGGQYMSQNFQVTGNSAETNFSLSLAHNDDKGSLIGSAGYRRSSIRINLDHRFHDDLSVGVSFFNSRDRRDNQGSGAFDEILNAPRDVDFSIQDAEGNYVQDPGGLGVQNPLWEFATRSDLTRGSRTLANLSLTWTPLSWFRASGNVGYDRGDSHQVEYVPKGTPGDIGDEDLLDGEIHFDDDLDEAWNAEGSLTLMRDFGQLNVRTTVRGIMEADRSLEAARDGVDFILFGVPQLSNVAPEDRNATSEERDIHSIGYLWDTAFDYAGKYIFSVLGRRDGSSLFGPDNRWHNYYRVAGAWRISQEDWFNVDLIDELKISVARGTAGGRPSFANQYETWTQTGGIPTKTTLGNRNLAPEHTTEHEFSLNMVIADRFGIVLTHARQSTEGQLNPGPLPAITGYSSQWQNAGTISGHTTEFEFEAQVIQQPNLNWTSMVVADYSNAKISEWDIPCYAQSWRWNCVDIPVYGIYSRWLLKDVESLNQHHGGSLLPIADQFEVNDEGFLVWVGEGNHYWEGAGENGILGDDDDLWGTSKEVNGVTYGWGDPFYERLELGGAHRTLLGEGAPSNFGWINNVQWGGFTFHAALHASVGGQTNNRHFQNMMRNTRLTSPELDQSGKDDELKKPISYYRAAVDGDNSYTIEDSSYLKMRTLSASYNMNQNTLSRFGLGGMGIEAIRLGLIVRNVFTLTNYDGFDPETGFDLNSLASSDSSDYPPTRTLTAEFEITF